MNESNSQGVREMNEINEWDKWSRIENGIMRIFFDSSIVFRRGERHFHSRDKAKSWKIGKNGR